MIATDIREKLKVAMKDKDQVALDTYRSVLSACTSELVATGKTPQDEVNDEMALSVIKRLIKQRKDAIGQFEAGNRPDLAENEKAQLALLEVFQPAQLSDAAILAVAVEKQAALGITDKAKAGILVGAVMKEVAGGADGAAVKRVVDSLFV